MKFELLGEVKKSSYRNEAKICNLFEQLHPLTCINCILLNHHIETTPSVLSSCIVLCNLPLDQPPSVRSQYPATDQQPSQYHTHGTRHSI